MSMKNIISSENPLYKKLKKIANSERARRKVGCTLLDGIHLANSYLQSGLKPILCIVSDKSLMHAEVSLVARQCEFDGVQCVVIPDKKYSTLSQVENGINLLFMVKIPKAVVPPALTQSAVLIDKMQDPGNLGSILRSAAAAGIKSAYCSKGSVSVWSPKVLRAGMGGHFMMDIFDDVDLVKLVRTAQVPVLATSSYAEKSIYQANLNAESAWIFGQEGHGIGKNLMDLVVSQVSIPHFRRVESLNVAAAAAVCFFEQQRQILS
jgi:TrmH family RNA methyltransferase